MPLFYEGGRPAYGGTVQNSTSGGNLRGLFSQATRGIYARRAEAETVNFWAPNRCVFVLD